MDQPGYRALYSIGWLMRYGGIVAGVGLGLFVFVAIPFAMWHTGREDLSVAHEMVFESLCPKYRDASTFEKWFKGPIRKISWCEDYLHSL